MKLENAEPNPATISKMVRLWTIQPEKVWQKLQQEKMLLVNPALSETYRGWPDSVEWLQEQMRKRLPGYNSNLPWWAWYKPKQDLRRIRWGSASGKPENYVRIELLLPEARVLISHIDAWIYVRNQWLVPYNNPEMTTWFDDPETYPSEDISKHLQLLTVSTWERIFDHRLFEDASLSNWRTADLWTRDWWQGTFEELRLEDVRRVTPFVSVPRKHNPWD